MTLFSFTGILGKGKGVLMCQVTSYLFVYHSLSCNNSSWCLRVRRSVDKLFKAPESLETICTEAQAHRFAFLWPLADIDGFCVSIEVQGPRANTVAVKGEPHALYLQVVSLEFLHSGLRKSLSPLPTTQWKHYNTLNPYISPSIAMKQMIKLFY